MSRKIDHEKGIEMEKGGKRKDEEEEEGGYTKHGGERGKRTICWLYLRRRWAGR